MNRFFLTDDEMRVRQDKADALAYAFEAYKRLTNEALLRKLASQVKTRHTHNGPILELGPNDYTRNTTGNGVRRDTAAERQAVALYDPGRSAPHRRDKP